MTPGVTACWSHYGRSRTADNDRTEQHEHNESEIIIRDVAKVREGLKQATLK
jgi:hypothetical protein